MAADEPGRDPAKRVRKAKKVARRPAAEAAEAAPVAAAKDAPAVVAAEPSAPTEDDGPARAHKQQKVGEGGAVLLQRCAGLNEVASATSEVSPPLEKVVARHAVFAQRAKATAARRSSSLGVCVRQADGNHKKEVAVDWLSRSVAIFRLGGDGAHC